MNNFYSHTSAVPVAQARGLSSPIRLELDSIAAAFDSVAQNVMGMAVESGAGNNFVLSLSPIPAAYPTKATMVFVATHANTGAATLQIAALTPIPLYSNDGTPLTSNYIKSGELVTVYVTSTGAFMLGATKSYVDNASFTSALPSQAGNAGKFITTDGVGASWGSTVTALVTGNGTVGAPAVTLGDSTTGLYRSAVNQIAFAAAGALAMLVDAGKNVSLYANLIFAGVAQRITADFSNATFGNRVSFQTSTANGFTTVGVIPNGSGATSGIALFSALDPDNASYLNVFSTAGVESGLNSNKSGTGAYLPLSFYTGGAQRMSISTAGVISMAAPLPVAAGGTGGSTQVAARTGLGVGTTDLPVFAGLNGGQLAGTRSRIINGSYRISNRFGSTVTALASVTRTYTMDRMIVYATAVTTFNRTTFVDPEGDQLAYGLQVSGAAGVTNVQAMQRIESWNCMDMANKAVVASIWVYSTIGSALTASVQVARANAPDDFSATTVENAFTVSVNGVVGTSIPSGQWCKISATATFSIGAVTGLELAFSLTGTITSGSVIFTKMQFELGLVATPFEWRSYGLELALCQRYFPVVTTALNAIIGIGQCTSTTRSLVKVAFPITPRVPPTGLIAPAVGSFYLTDASYTAKFCTALAISSTDPTGAMVQADVASGLVAGNASILSINGTYGLIFTGCEL